MSKVTLPKATGHTTLTFQNYRLKKKLLQELEKTKQKKELGNEMFMIISSTVQSKISPFSRFIWGDQLSTGICYYHCQEIHYCLSFTAV